MPTQMCLIVTLMIQVTETFIMSEWDEWMLTLLIIELDIAGKVKTVKFTIMLSKFQ